MGGFPYPRAGFVFRHCSCRGRAGMTCSSVAGTPMSAPLPSHSQIAVVYRDGASRSGYALGSAPMFFVKGGRGFPRKKASRPRQPPARQSRRPRLQGKGLAAAHAAVKRPRLVSRPVARHRIHYFRKTARHRDYRPLLAQPLRPRHVLVPLLKLPALSRPDKRPRSLREQSPNVLVPALRYPPVPHGVPGHVHARPSPR